MADADDTNSPGGTAGGATISAGEAARLLMLENTRRVQQLAADGYITRAGQGRYYTVSVIQGYIRFLREERKDNSRTESERRVRDARARAIELNNARTEHELVELTEVEGVLDEIAGMLRSEFNGFPTTMTRDLTMRRKMETGIDGIFRRASTRIAETLAALKQSGEVVDTDAEDDT